MTAFGGGDSLHSDTSEAPYTVVKLQAQLLTRTLREYARTQVMGGHGGKSSNFETSAVAGPDQ
jgi:hypothetical protein